MFSVAYAVVVLVLVSQNVFALSNSKKSKALQKNEKIENAVLIKKQNNKTITVKEEVLDTEKKAPSRNILYKSVEELKHMGRVETFDFNKDNEIDAWSYYEVGDDDTGDEELQLQTRKKLLYRKDLDINFDKKIDIVRQYKDGKIVREAVDFDYDGKFDMISFYRNGDIALKEFDFKGDGKTDVWKYYSNKKLVLKEVDRNFDGIVDLWAYFHNDKILRIGQDTNGDGSPDKWSK